MFYELAEKKWKGQVINKCRGHLRNQYFDAQGSDKAIQTLAEFCIHLFVAIYVELLFAPFPLKIKSQFTFIILIYLKL